jgi:hypothetical protein
MSLDACPTATEIGQYELRDMGSAEPPPSRHSSKVIFSVKYFPISRHEEAT